MHDCVRENQAINVLIIEDNEADVRLLEIMMRRADNIHFTTRNCDSIEGALELLSCEPFDIVLLDLGLPDSQGLESIRKIISHPSETPFIVLTGLKDEKLGVEAVRLGAQDYMVKGDIDTKSLIRSICYSLERKEAEEERRSLRAQLLQAQKMEALGTLAGGIAHDFNNILTIMKRNMEIALLNEHNGDEWHRALEAAEEASKTGSRLIQRLLQFGRPAKTGLAVIRLSQVVQETLAFLRAIIPASIEVKEFIEPSPCSIKAEPSTVSLIITNLCINARDAMPRGGTLAVETSLASIDENFCKEHPEAHPGEFCVLKVSDTGMGIPCTILDRIFDPFFTTKAEGKGTGLGLSMVYSTVKSMGGWLQCMSSEGKGTEFTLYFPQASGTPRDMDTGSCSGVSEKAAEPQKSPGTVLFADDKEILLLFGRKVLEENGFSVLTARDGEEALSLFRKRDKEISVAILDLEMPKMGGIQVMEEIKKISPRMPVIFISSHPYDNIRELSGGKVSSLLSKDYSPQDILELIRQVLNEQAQDYVPA